MVRRIRTLPQHLRRPGRAAIALCGLLAVFGFALPALLAVHLSPDSRALGPRRVTDLIERFLAHGYDVRAVASGQVRVPRLFLSQIPKDWRGLVPADKRKEAFVILVLPLVLQANEHVHADRQRLVDLAAQTKKGKSPSAPDLEWLEALAATYGTMELPSSMVHWPNSALPSVVKREVPQPDSIAA